MGRHGLATPGVQAHRAAAPACSVPGPGSLASPGRPWAAGGGAMVLPPVSAPSPALAWKGDCLPLFTHGANDDSSGSPSWSLHPPGRAAAHAPGQDACGAPRPAPRCVCGFTLPTLWSWPLLLHRQSYFSHRPQAMGQGLARSFPLATGGRHRCPLTLERAQPRFCAPERPSRGQVGTHTRARPRDSR